MRPLLHVLLLLLLAASGARAEPGGFAVPKGEIAIADEESPVAASHGIQPAVGRADSFSYAGSTPESLQETLEQLDAPLAWEAQRQMAVLALSAPVLPDAEASVPEGWLLLRLKTLMRIGEYDAALALFKGLNTSLLTEPLARIGSDLYWAMGREKKACRITAGLTEDDTTKFESERSKLYWLVHYLLCQRIAGKQAEAELSLGLLRESVAKDLPPLLTPLVEDWGSDAPLPPLSEADRLIYPALAALLSLPVETGKPLTERIGKAFVTPERAADLPPELQATLAQVEALDILLRAFMAEAAVRHHLMDAAQLGRYYDLAARREGDVPEALRATHERALLYADAVSARTPRNQAMAVAEALRRYHGAFSARQARSILGGTLRQLSSETAALDLPLTFETMALYLDRGDLDEARAVAARLARRDGPAAELGSTAAGKALLLAGATQTMADRTVALPEWSQPPPAETLWLMRRFGRLMESQGLQVRWPSRFQEFTAPPPEIDFVPPARLQALYTAQNASPAERLLRSVLVLNGTPPQRTSEQALLQVIAAWDALGLGALTRPLIAEALFGLPDPREP